MKHNLHSWFRQNKHVWWVLYLPLYLVFYFIAEHAVVTDYWVSYCKLDDYIPFIRQFVLAYVSWYPMLVGVGLWLLFKDGPAFRRYMIALAVGFTGSLIFCMIFPNGQDLRPELTENDLFTQIIRALYTADTNTNVMPSMHVVGCFAALAGVWDTKTIRSKWVRPALVVLCIFINLSTVFIKQHSVLDILGGFAMSAIMLAAVYWLPRLCRNRRARNVEK